jgi:hypothetical protein
LVQILKQILKQRQQILANIEIIMLHDESKMLMVVPTLKQILATLK